MSVKSVSGLVDGTTSLTVECAAQCKIQANTATTNFQDSGEVGQEGGSFAGKNLMQFPLVGIPKTITDAFLRFVILNNANCLGANEGVNAHILAKRLVRTNINYSQATWNVYSTGNNWGTAGAANTSTDHTTYGTSWHGPYPSAGSRLLLGTGAMVQLELLNIREITKAALDSDLANLDFYISATATGGQNKFTIASRTDGTTDYRPKLIVLL